MLRFLISLPITTFLGVSAICAQRVDLTVSQDGLVDVKTVQEAIDKVSENNKKRFTIIVKPINYQEQFKVAPSKQPTKLHQIKGAWGQRS